MWRYFPHIFRSVSVLSYRLHHNGFWYLLIYLSDTYILFCSLGTQQQWACISKTNRYSFQEKISLLFDQGGFSYKDLSVCYIAHILVNFGDFKTFKGQILANLPRMTNLELQPYQKAKNNQVVDKLWKSFNSPVFFSLFNIYSKFCSQRDAFKGSNLTKLPRNYLNQNPKKRSIKIEKM